MITPEMIERINALSRKQRAEGLNDAEKAEQARLRSQYLEGIRQQVKNSLDSMVRQDDAGCSCKHH